MSKSTFVKIIKIISFGVISGSLFVLIVPILIYSIFLKKDVGTTKILGDINIQAVVNTCDFNIKVIPEDRTYVNYSTALRMEIENSNNNLEKYTFNVNTDANGEASINLCASGINVSKGVYLFHLWGLSHLGRIYGGYETFKYARDNIDFSVSGKNLIAGECGNVNDNKINSLDGSGVIKRLGTNVGNSGYSTKYDLNLDNQIDEADAQIIIRNFYKLGE